METDIKPNIKVINIVSEPIQASELYYNVFKKDFNNIIQDKPTIYDLKTIYSKDKTGYLYNKANTMNDLLMYINENIKRKYEVNENE